MKHNKYNYILFILLLLSQLMVAQDDVTAKITNEMGTPIGNARIFANEGAVKAYTNTDGEFKIKSKETDVIRIEADGYETIILSVAQILRNKTLTLSESLIKGGESDKLFIPFGKTYSRNVVGDISVLNAAEILNQEEGKGNLISSINGRVSGVFGSQNILGMGNALVVIDGIPRSFNDINSTEVDQITILKDATAKMLYGAQAERGVIMITTKRGVPFHRKMNIYVENTISQPKALPAYLNSASYMELYNEARTNDGLPVLYTQQSIDKTRDGIDPLVDKEAYANEDYYSSTYLRNFTNSQKVSLDASGGNDVAQYYVNIGLESGNKLLNLGEEKNARNSAVNVRGNVDYKIGDRIKAKLDIYSAIKDEQGANTDFWSNASTLLPNYYPVLINSSLLPEEMSMGANLIDGRYVLGGTSNYQTNLYGELSNTGYSNLSENYIQLSTGVDIDFGFITQGLTGSILFSYDSWNTDRTFQNNKYAVYEPVWGQTALDTDSLTFTKINSDDLTGTLSKGDAAGFRHFTYIGYLNYKKSMSEDHDINAVATFMYDRTISPGTIFTDKNLTIGQRLAYSYKNKYFAEFDGAVVGSGKLPEKNQFNYSSAFGIAWLASEEDFLKEIPMIDYLKFRGSFGTIYTDNAINEYYLYNTSFNDAGNYNYNDGAGTNLQWDIAVLGNPELDWIKKKDVNVGFEALINNSWWFEGGFFYRKSTKEVGQLVNTNPGYIGPGTLYQNYNESQRKGAEFGMSYRKKIKDFNLSLGYNMVYSISETLKLDEPNYEESYRSRVGKSTDAQFGLIADGLYQPGDFATIDYDNNIFVLNEGVIKSAYGEVQPGDIKYIDQNGDDIINDSDQKKIGNSTPRFQQALNFEVQYKNFQFFAMAVARLGQTVYYNNNYYQVYGETKYSDQVLDRYHFTNNPNGTYPRLSTTASGSSHNFKQSTFWLYNSNQLNIQAVQLSYSIPRGVIEKLKMEQFKVYVRSSDLLTISSISKKIDLNVGSAPKMRYVSLGISAKF